jgi:hypothetical protein
MRDEPQMGLNQLRPGQNERICECTREVEFALYDIPDASQQHFAQMPGSPAITELSIALPFTFKPATLEWKLIIAPKS